MSMGLICDICSLRPTLAKGMCKSCYRRHRRQLNPERERAAARRRRAARREQYRAAARRRHAIDPQRRRNRDRQRYANDKRAVLKRNRQWRHQHIHQVRARDRERSRRRYDRAKAREYRQHWLKRHPDYFRNYSRTHSKEVCERVAQWRKRNPETMREYGRAWQQRRRARRLCALGLFSASDWKTLLKRHGHKCYYCGVESFRLTQDHKVPLSRGGAHSALNIVPACRSCNSKKGTRSAEEFVSARLETVA